MYRTLFHIPREIAGVPLFGFGALLAIFVIASVAYLVWRIKRFGAKAEVLSYLPVLAIIGAVIAFVLPALSDARGVPIQGYGTMVLLGVICGLALAVYRAEQVGLSGEVILGLTFWMLIAGIIGARLFYVIEYWETQFARPTLGETLAAALNVAGGGLVVYGSLIGAGVAFFAYAWKHRLPALALADLVTPSLLVGLALGRVGCLLNGCCFGGVCDLPWAVTFPAASAAQPQASPPYQRQAEAGLIPLHGLYFAADPNAPPVILKVEAGSPAEAAGLKSGQLITSISAQPKGTDEQPVDAPSVKTIEQAQLALLRIFGEGTEISIKTAGSEKPATWTITGPTPRSLPIHPTQLYSTIDSVLLALFLVAYYPFRRHDGEVLALGLTIHPIARFLLEDIRTDEPAVFGTPWSISQNISLLILVAAVALWVYILRQPRRTSELFPQTAH